LFIFYKSLHGKYESSLILYFKVRAYVNAANVIENLSHYLRRISKNRGKKNSSPLKIKEFLTTFEQL